MKNNLLYGIGLCSLMNSVFAQQITLNEENFHFTGKTAEFSEMYGQKCLKLNGAEAQLKDITITNGTIEYDVGFDEDRNFIGVNFRRQNQDNTEKVYLRSHQSGNPDANQYTPVYHGLSAWQLYHHGFAGKVNYHFDQWNRIKVDITGETGKVYINDMEQAAFNITEFLRPVMAGGISFTSARKDACFRNIKINVDSNKYPTKKLSSPKAIDGLINDWKISTSFNNAQLENSTELNATFTKQLNWKAFSVNSYGILNMARAQGVSNDANTAFAKTILHAKQNKISALSLGFSDQATVYLNGKKLYSGSNKFKSRDYRYLGTIGLFDTVYLPLKKGENELIIAVTESFGGWGIKAALKDN